jgi:rRNA maturation endonuclease Nob1
MPTNVHWEDGIAEIEILCDGCDKDYKILTKETEGLELCPFCGHYIEHISEMAGHENSWN